MGWSGSWEKTLTLGEVVWVLQVTQTAPGNRGAVKCKKPSDDTTQ